MEGDERLTPGRIDLRQDCEPDFMLNRMQVDRYCLSRRYSVRVIQQQELLQHTVANYDKPDFVSGNGLGFQVDTL
jgi:hypothetical protein